MLQKCLKSLPYQRLGPMSRCVQVVVPPFFLVLMLALVLLLLALPIILVMLLALHVLDRKLIKGNERLYVQSHGTHHSNLWANTSWI